MLRGEEVHGESITDGDASGGIAVVLYKAGSVVVRTLGAKEILYVTDIQITCETGGDVWLVADGKVAGEYVWYGSLNAKDTVSISLQQPFACAPGTGLTLFGAATNLNICLIEGFIAGA